MTYRYNMTRVRRALNRGRCIVVYVGHSHNQKACITADSGGSGDEHPRGWGAVTHWPVAMGGMCSYTKNAAFTSAVGQPFRINDQGETGVSFNTRGLGDLVSGFHVDTTKCMFGKLWLATFSANVANNLLCQRCYFGMHSLLTNPWQNATPWGVLSQDVTLRLRWIRSTTGQPASTSPKIRVGWTDGTTHVNVLNTSPNWAAGGTGNDNELVYQDIALGSLQDQVDALAIAANDAPNYFPFFDLLGGNADETGAIAYDVQLIFDGHTGPNIYLGGEGNTGYKTGGASGNGYADNITAAGVQATIASLVDASHDTVIFVDDTGFQEVVVGTGSLSWDQTDVQTLRDLLYDNAALVSGVNEVLYVHGVSEAVPASVDDPAKIAKHGAAADIKLAAAKANRADGDAALIRPPRRLGYSTVYNEAANFSDNRHWTLAGSRLFGLDDWRGLTGGKRNVFIRQLVGV